MEGMQGISEFPRPAIPFVSGWAGSLQGLLAQPLTKRSAFTRMEGEALDGLDQPERIFSADGSCPSPSSPPSWLIAFSGDPWRISKNR